MAEKTEKKPTKPPAPEVTVEYKILQELKLMNDTLNGMKNILNNIWRERRPQ